MSIASIDSRFTFHEATAAAGSLDKRTKSGIDVTVDFNNHQIRYGYGTSEEHVLCGDADCEFIMEIDEARILRENDDNDIEENEWFFDEFIGRLPKYWSGVNEFKIKKAFSEAILDFIKQNPNSKIALALK